MKKKLVKTHKKMNIWEVSACGIPMYPKAHKSFSLVKALTESEAPALVSEELNKEKDLMEDEETKPEGEAEAETKPETKPEGEEETAGETESDKPDTEAPAEAEAPEETKSAKTPLISKKIEKQLAALINQKIEKQMNVFMEKAFSQALKESQVPRGLVEEKIDVQVELKKKSIGELAIACGLFKEAPKMGSTLEIM